MRRVFIIILNWNRAEDTIGCINSVSRLSVIGCQLSVMVVDNASDDISKLKTQMSKLQLKSKNLLLIENKENVGFAAGNNIGIRYAMENGADYVMILNNDTIVRPDSMIQIIRTMEKDPKIGLVSPKIYFAKGYEFHKRSLLDPSKERYEKKELGKVIWYAGGKIDWDNVYGSTRGVDEVDHGRYDEVEETDFATGACVVMSRKLVEKVGMFDEKYFMYYEDTDLSVRAKKAGFKILYVPRATLWHKVGRSSAIGSELNDYFITRNRLLFGMKYASLRTKIALVKESIKLLLTGRKWQRVGIKDYYLERFGSGSWN